MRHSIDFMAQSYGFIETEARVELVCSFWALLTHAAKKAAR